MPKPINLMETNAGNLLLGKMYAATQQGKGKIGDFTLEKLEKDTFQISSNLGNAKVKAGKVIPGDNKGGMRLEEYWKEFMNALNSK